MNRDEYEHVILNGRPGVTIDQARETFAKWLHLPDPGALYVMLAAVAANRMQGDPVWLVQVGPPGGGKTETIASLSGLEEIHFAATLTEASLLSGTPKRERAGDSTGGLLRQVGEYGIIVCKDFTSVLAMNKDTRGQVLAALREVYDGDWTRLVGTDGGRALHWSGKCGMIAGCTPTIDRHHAVMGAMGERFVLYRLPEADEDELGRRSLEHVGHEAEMRLELRDVVTGLLASISLPESAPRPSGNDIPRLVDLASFVVRARSAVERDGYSREIELIPGSEAPTRLVNALARMLASLRIIGVSEAEAWRLTTKMGLDSIPAIRREVIEHLVRQDAPVHTSTVAETLGYPKRTAERALEDLTAHKLITARRKGSTKPIEWRATEWAAQRWARITTAPDYPSSRVGVVEDKDVRAQKTASGLSGAVSQQQRLGEGLR